jgi:dynein heavy chain
MMHKFMHSKNEKLVKLWVHEIARVFTDRLSCEDDQMKVYKYLAIACRIHIKEDLPTCLRGCLTKKHEEAGEQVEHALDIMTEHIRFTDLLDPNKRNREYDEVSKNRYSDLVQKLYTSLRDGYNVLSKKPMDLVLFDFAVTHILRITRVLKISKGNILLIGLGGSGRQSLSTLSAYLMDQELFESKQTKNYRQEDWVQEVKDLMMKAGLAKKNCVFLLNDYVLKYSYVLADVNNLINQYEIPGVFGKDDKVAIYETCRANAREDGRMDLYNTVNPNHLMDYFTKRVEKCLHVILCMSPTGSTLQERIRMFPSLVNCCTINWFTDWPRDALIAVAQKFLEEIPNVAAIQENIKQVCFRFHNDCLEMSRNFMKQLKRPTYITPTTYLDLMNVFEDLLRKQGERLQNKK